MKILLILLYIATCSIGAQYVGVPVPTIDYIEAKPARPSNWTSDVASYYYVDYFSGTDSGRTYGNPLAPRKTIPSSLAAGTYVEISGFYSPGSDVSLTLNGTVNEKVWIVGSTSNTAPRITRKIVIRGSNAILDGLNTEQNGSLQVGSATVGYGATNIVLRYGTHAGTNNWFRSAITMIGSYENGISNVVVYSNTLHDCGDFTTLDDNDAHIVTVSAHVEKCWILGNTLYNSAGSGVSITGIADYDRTRYIYVAGNTMYNNRQAGIGVKYGSDLIISGNIIHDVIDASWSPSKGIGMQYIPNRVWCINNTIYNVRYGIRVASTSAGEWSVYCVGNLLYNINLVPLVYGNGELAALDNTYLEGAISMVGADNHYIVNNTIVNSYGGINLTSGSGIQVVENNIVQDVLYNHHVWIAYTNLAVVENNIFYQTPNVHGGVYSYARGANASAYSSISNYNSSVHFISNWQADPMLSTSYLPAVSSLAVGGGKVSDVYETFQNLYGESIAFDISGTARPQNGSWDIGAYEYVDPVKRFFPFRKN